MAVKIPIQKGVGEWEKKLMAVAILTSWTATVGAPSLGMGIVLWRGSLIHCFLGLLVAAIPSFLGHI